MMQVKKLLLENIEQFQKIAIVRPYPIIDIGSSGSRRQKNSENIPHDYSDNYHKTTVSKIVNTRDIETGSDFATHSKSLYVRNILSDMIYIALNKQLNKIMFEITHYFSYAQRNNILHLVFRN